MDKISIKEYARSHGISSEIVRRQIVKYAKELEGHLTAQGKTKLLDEEAVAILDQHRIQRNVMVEITDPEAQREIEKLQETIAKLRMQLDEAKNKVLELQSDQIRMQEKHIVLIEEKSRYQGMIEEKERTEREKDQRIADLAAGLKERQDQVDELRKDLGAFQKSLFGFWRKKKGD